MNNTQPPISAEHTERSFDCLLRRLDSDRDCAGRKYEEIRQKLIRFFAWNDCDMQADLADEVLDRVALRLENEDVRDVMAFAWGVARNLVREWRKRLPEVAIDDLPPDQSPSAAHPESSILKEAEKQRRILCLRRCIRRLSPAERELFLNYEYYNGRPGNTRQLAQNMGLTVGALHTKVHRIKQKIEQCAIHCFDERQNGSWKNASPSLNKKFPK